MTRASVNAITSAAGVIELGRSADEPSHEAYAHAGHALAYGYAGHLAEGKAVLAAGEIRLEAEPQEALPYLRRGRDAAERAGSWFFADLAGLSVVCCAARLGETTDAMNHYATLIDHWHRAGAWVQFWIAVRSLVVLLARAGGRSHRRLRAAGGRARRRLDDLTDRHGIGAAR